MSDSEAVKELSAERNELQDRINLIDPKLFWVWTLKIITNRSRPVKMLGNDSRSISSEITQNRLINDLVAENSRMNTQVGGGGGSFARAGAPI